MVAQCGPQLIKLLFDRFNRFHSSPLTIKKPPTSGGLKTDCEDVTRWPLSLRESVLDIRAVFAACEKAQGIREKILAGHLRNLSVGYTIKKSAYLPQEQVTELLELELLEGSVVPVPANPLANISGAKSITDQQGNPSRVRRLSRLVTLYMETLR